MQDGNVLEIHCTAMRICLKSLNCMLKNSKDDEFCCIFVTTVKNLKINRKGGRGARETEREKGRKGSSAVCLEDKPTNLGRGRRSGVLRGVHGVTEIGRGEAVVRGWAGQGPQPPVLSV